MQIKYDTEIYAGPLSDQNGDVFVYKRIDFPRWLNVGAEFEFTCYKINSDGEVNLDRLYKFLKKDLTDNFIANN